MADIAGILPEITLLVGATALLLAAPNQRRGLLGASIATLTLAVATILQLGTLTELPGLGFMPQDATVLGLFEIDVFSSVLKVAFLVGTAIVVIGSPSYMRRSAMQAEYYALMLTSVFGMMVVASSRDLLTLFLGIEVTAFSTYILAGSFKDDPSSVEASTKYFITGALSSTLTLYGISLLYGAAGTITFEGLSAFWQQELGRYAAFSAPAMYLFIFQPIISIGVFMILGGIGFKFTLAPFHMWAPDTYTGAPDTVSSFLAGVGKGLAVVAFYKVFFWALGPLEAGWAPFLAFLAILTMTWGNLVAIKQDNIKRMLAYSSIAQAGYILIVLPVGTEYAIAGGIFHTVTNLLMKGGAFLVVAALATAGIGSRIQDYEGIGRKNPLLGISLTIFLLSLAGLPPLGGFWSKFVLFSSAVEPAVAGTGASWLVWLAVAGILNSVISLYYYARWIRAMYVENPIHPVKVRIPGGTATAIVLSLVGIIAVGLWANPMLDWSLEAARSLVAAI